MGVNVIIFTSHKAYRDFRKKPTQMCWFAVRIFCGHVSEWLSVLWEKSIPADMERVSMKNVCAERGSQHPADVDTCIQ